MASEHEDLEFNTFLNGLQKRFPKLYDKASDNCYLICVPKTSSLPQHGPPPPQQIFEQHILKPSPLFKGQFESLSLTNPKVVAIQGNLIIPKEGFKYPQPVKVEFEELFYNANYQPFRVLCIECPLDSRPRNTVPDALEPLVPESGADFFAPKLSFEDHMTWIREFCEGHGIAQVTELIQTFIASYLLVPGYLDHLVAKVQSLCEKATDIFIQSPKILPHLADSRCRPLVSLSAESFVLDAIYHKITTAVSLEVESEAKRYSFSLDRVTKFMLKVPPQFDCDLTPAVGELNSIADVRTPFEKHLAIRDTFDKIGKCVQFHMLKTRGSSDASVIAADDMIPLLAAVVLQSRLPSLPAEVKYLECFGFSTQFNAEFSYHLVTLSAALQYLVSLFEPSPEEEALLMAGGGSNSRSSSFNKTPYPPQTNSSNITSLNNSKPAFSMTDLILNGTSAAEEQYLVPERRKGHALAPTHPSNNPSTFPHTTSSSFNNNSNQGQKKATNTTSPPPLIGNSTSPVQSPPPRPKSTHSPTTNKKSFLPEVISLNKPATREEMGDFLSNLLEDDF